MLSYILPPRSPLLISPLPPPPTVTPAFYLQHSTQPRPVPVGRHGMHEPPAGAGQAEPRGHGSPESPSRARGGGGRGQEDDREMRTGAGLGGGGTTAPSCMRTARGTAFNCPRSASSTKGRGAPGSPPGPVSAQERSLCSARDTATHNSCVRNSPSSSGTAEGRPPPPSARRTVRRPPAAATQHRHRTAASGARPQRIRDG